MTIAHTAELVDFVHRQKRLFIITGAGISTASGIATYRDESGQWQHSQPIQWQDFRSSKAARQRYWARSLIGWPRFAAAQPNAAHYVLTALERAGYVHQLVTQNVDGLHQLAGTQQLIDLHGRLDQVLCLSCDRKLARNALQTWLVKHNPRYVSLSAKQGPDGDAKLDEQVDLTAFNVPSCADCGGMLKPDVVFFGENVPRPRVDSALSQLRSADALLVVGSSLMVYSGYRFCAAAKTLGIPMGAINMGRTRADGELDFKIPRPCAQVLEELAAALDLEV